MDYDQKDIIIDILNRAVIEIDKADKYTEDKRDIYDNLSKVIDELKSIRSVVGTKKKAMQSEVKALKTLIDEISNIKSDLILENVDKMFDIINRNLIDNMFLGKSNINSSLMNIIYQNIQVGTIEVLDDKPDIKISVNVYGNTDEFTISDPLKMYSIISFINTKFNYKEE